MACVPVSVNPKFGDPYKITVYSNKFESGIEQKDYEKEGTYAKEYAELMSRLKSATKQQALVALFNGTISGKVEVVKLNATTTPAKSNSEVTIARFELKYLKEQTVKYKSEDVTYKSMLFTIKQDAGRDKIEVYLLNGKSAQYQLEYYGNFDKVYDYVNVLINGKQA